jgi:signal transduction histidine kinase
MSDDLSYPERPNPPPPGQRPPARPALAPEDPSSGPLNADRLTVVAHELRNMIDGSMRWLGLAAAALPEGEVAGDADRLCAAREQILTVQGTLERMSSMVNAALRNRTVPIGSPLLGVSSVVTLGMAIDHALDVVRPLARERGVQVRVTIDPEAGSLPAGPLYTVVLNGVINAVQSIGRAAERDTLNPGGLVEVRAFRDRVHPDIVVDILDDGAGVDPSVRGERAFRHGVTTRADGHGIGLAISRQIVASLDGVISLADREDREGSHRPGAVLRVRFPIPDPAVGDRLVG